MNQHSGSVCLIISIGIFFACVSPLAAQLRKLRFSVKGAGTTGSTAPVLEPLVKEDGLKRIEISAPGEFFESNAHYVLTKDITAKRDGLLFGKPWTKRISNCIIDLNGHTITYNDEGYKPDFRSVCYGIRTFGPGPVVIRNGVIIQGKGGDNGCHGINLRGTLADVYDLSVRVKGPSCSNIAGAGGGKGGRIHDNYLENSVTTVARTFSCPTGISMTYAGGDWEVYNNTIIGGHRCISVAANARANQVTRTKIHHNRLSPRRTQGVKAPHAIMIYTAEQNEVYENMIDAIDARGINVQMSSKDNRVHHNIVGARYSTVAPNEKSGYIENRCYGYWERSGGRSGNSFTHNLVVVNNATTGDRTSESRGIFAGTGSNYPEPLMTGEYSNNVVICDHVDASCPVTGIYLKQVGDGVVVENNRVIARTVGVSIRDKSAGAKVRRNLLFKTGRRGWKAIVDEAGKCATRGNLSCVLTADRKAPKPPVGLEVIKRPGAIELRWKRSPEDDVVAYRVLRDGKTVKMPMRIAPFWVDLNVKPGQKHRYAVRAVDITGKRSKPCADVKVVVK